MERITDCLARHAQQQPDMLAVVDGKQQITFAELHRAVNGMAQQLCDAGVTVGDRVAVRGHDGAATLVAALAVLSLGGVHAPVDHTLADVEIETLIRALQTPWRLDIPRAATVAELSQVNPLRTECPRCEDPLGVGQSAFLRLSSGTTGTAKGILLSHRSLLERVTAANKGLQLGTGDRVLWLLPMAYHFAVSILLYMHNGVTIVFGNALRASGTAAIARENQVTFAYGSPWHIRRLAELPVGTDLPSTLKRVVSTTTALDATAAHDFRKRHGIGVCQGLGIIEVGLPFISEGKVGEVPGDLGQPLPDFTVRLCDENGCEVPDGQSGELAIAGPGMLDAYLSPWRTRDDIMQDGFFRTGDRAEWTAEKGIRLLGRLKDVINVGGVKVFPLEVESVLDAHAAVVASRVCSQPEARLGEQVHADVQLQPGVDADKISEELAAWCAERLAPLKRPASFSFVEKLEMTASGKVIRNQG